MYIDDDNKEDKQIVSEIINEEEPVEKVLEEPAAEGVSEENDSDEKPKEKTPPWLQRRINKEVAEKHALRRRIEQLEASKEETLPETVLTEEEVDRRALAKAEEISYQKDFNKSCNRTYNAAVEEFKDFPSNFKELRENVGDITIPMAEVINDLEGGHKVLNFLATNLDEASRIYELSPTKMAIELTKLNDRLTKPKTKQLSKAPAPLATVGGGSKLADGLSDSLSDDEWIRRRNEQRRKAGRL